MVVLLGAGAYWLGQTPFRPERPAEPKVGLTSIGVQDVDARLWQDPFAAVAEVRKGAKGDAGGCRSVEVREDGKGLLISDCSREQVKAEHSLQWLSRQIESRLARAPSPRSGAEAESFESDETAKSVASPRVLILAVMVSGGPSAGAEESRRRYRYASLSALMQEGYFPEDAEHVGYVSLDKHAPPDYLPFEWFSRTDQDRSLLLLWVDDGSLRRPESVEKVSDQAKFTPSPLARLSRLLTTVVPDNAKGVNKDQVSLRIIGPANSTTLQAMADEYRGLVPAGQGKESSGRECAEEHCACIWSPFATIPAERVNMGSRKVPVYGCPPGTEGCVGVLPPGVRDSVRTIAADDVLVRMLVEELQRRGVEGKAAVALVGQLDTAYARTLADLFEQRWGTERVKRFSYLRGLDGQTPGAKAAEKGNGKGAGDARDIERPTGDAQTDYLRRMRDALLAEDSRSRADCDFSDRLKQRCGLRAVGVLGDDYYDKLLVLQALKPVFPEAIFFTTDLNAAMFHPRDNLFTRNLVVASGFGLTLAHEWQGAIPPLRDSYQTSTVLAVRMAVRDAIGEASAVEMPPPARLFEIGRTRPVELITRKGERPFLRQLAQSGSAAGVEPEFDPHPREDLEAHFGPQGWNGGAGALGLLMILSLSALFLVLVAGRKRVSERAAGFWGFVCTNWATKLLSVFCVIAVFAVAYTMIRDVGEGGEPLTLFEGVSIWPSELLRMVAGLLAVYFLVRGYRRHQEALHLTELEFQGLSGERESAATVSMGREAAADEDVGEGAGDQPCAGLFLTVDEERRKARRPASEIWRAYMNGCGWRSTWRPVLLQVLVFLALAFALMGTIGFPNRPTRSALSWYLDLFVILLILLPFLTLLLYMVRATLRTLTLARDLEHPVSWPAETLRVFGFSNWTERDGSGSGSSSDVVWLDVGVIARVSKPVGDLVWYPIFLLILIALSRHPWFDSWTLPPALVVLMVVVLVSAIASAVMLRRAAERVRAQATKELTRALLRAQGLKGTESCQKQLESLLREVAAIREGAFRPFSHQPVVQALLTLASSISGLHLLQYFALLNL